MSGRAAPSGQRETEDERQRNKWDRLKKKRGEKRTRVNAALAFLSNLFLRVEETLYFPFAAEKSNSFSWNWQVFVSGQLTIFSLPVMKVVAGVSALGGNGRLFIPLKAQRHTCFAWSVICNCGISWEAREQSTLCLERTPPARLKSVSEKSKRDTLLHTSLILSLLFLLLNLSVSLIRS